jgi:hypothetical protein
VDAPYRTVDTLTERLGASFRVHRLSVLASAGTLLLATTLLVPPLLVLDEIATGTAESMTPLELVLAPVLFAAAICLFVRFFRTRDLRLDLRLHGFVHRARGVETVVPWEDVTRIRAIVSVLHSSRSGRFGYVVTSKGGAKVELPYAFEGIQEIRGVLERECARHLLPAAVAEIEARRPVSFGPFVATSAGLSYDERMLPWNEIKGAAVVRGMLAVGDKVDGIGLLPKREGVIAWARAPYVAIPNGPVLLALVEHLKGAS